MEDTLKNSYTEVSQILDILGESYKKKIPQRLIKLFEENKNVNYKCNITKNIKIEDMQISRTTLIIISILNLKYWANEDEKKRLKAIYDKNEIEYQEKINKYKQQDWLKKDKIKSENKSQITSLIQYEETSLIKKIKKFLKNLIHKRKRD